MRGIIVLFVGFFGALAIAMLIVGCSAKPVALKEMSASDYFKDINKKCMTACNRVGQESTGFRFVGLKQECLCSDLPTKTVVAPPKKPAKKAKDKK